MWAQDIIIVTLKRVDEVVEVAWVVPCAVDNQDCGFALRPDDSMAITFNGTAC